LRQIRGCMAQGEGTAAGSAGTSVGCRSF
jgi:hypothetical protein